MGFVTNNPDRSNEDADQTLSSAMAVYILPAWVFETFTSRFNLSEIHTYAKLRQVMSIEDLAHLEILRREALKCASKGSYPQLDEMAFRSLISTYSCFGQNVLEITPKEMAEVESSVNLLVSTPSVIAEAMDRFRTLKTSRGDCLASDSSELDKSSIPPTEELSTHCRAVVLNTTLYIIVEEGFLSYLEGDAGHLAFLSQVLKSAYAVLPVRMVNRSPWYKQYLTALAA